VLSSAAESVLGRLPSDTTRAEVLGELATEFPKVKGHHSKLEWPAARIYEFLLEPPLSQAWLADYLDEATRQRREELREERQRQN
jgi:hypothetical protein